MPGLVILAIVQFEISGVRDEALDLLHSCGNGQEAITMAFSVAFSSKRGCVLKMSCDCGFDALVVFSFLLPLESVHELFGRT